MRVGNRLPPIDAAGDGSGVPLPEPNTMGFMLWLATEGGSKCPQCGRYAKTEELGNLSFNFKTEDGTVGRVSMYGHLTGFGCNKVEDDP